MRPRRADEVEPYVTRDGSAVREIVGPPSATAANQSIAEATVAPGAETIEHYHRASEEIYVFTAGAGRMRLGDEEAEVSAGDTVAISPGTRHKLWNPGPEPLVVLCCSAPPYSHEDTVLCE
jgi:mannose-6-phosphate isomerase-like protein (cupin superfamily)